MMVDYQKMYVTLFQGITSAINGLQEVQRETEEEYIKANPAGTVLTLIQNTKIGNNEDNVDK